MRATRLLIWPIWKAYSLVSRAADSPLFTIHKLVQEVTRRQIKDPEQLRLNESLQWLDAAFVGNPQDVRAWPVLEPLAPHALTVVHYADEQGIAHPTSRLMNQLGVLYLTKALYRQAEPLMRRPLTIDETSFTAEHPNVARDLNNLAQLLQATNRLAEAEPLMRRALTIVIRSYGVEHPRSQTVLQNYFMLGQSLGWSEDQIEDQILEAVKSQLD